MPRARRCPVRGVPGRAVRIKGGWARTSGTGHGHTGRCGTRARGLARAQLAAQTQHRREGDGSAHSRCVPRCSLQGRHYRDGTTGAPWGAPWATSRSLEQCAERRRCIMPPGRTKGLRASSEQPVTLSLQHENDEEGAAVTSAQSQCAHFPRPDQLYDRQAASSDEPTPLASGCSRAGCTQLKSPRRTHVEGGQPYWCPACL